LRRIANALCLICPGRWLLARVQPTPFLQQLLLGLATRRIGHTGTCRAYLNAVRCLIGSHALGAPVSINGMCRADGFIGASWPTVSTQPGNCSALFSDDFVGYCLSFLSGLVFTIVTFPLRNVNLKQSYLRLEFSTWSFPLGVKRTEKRCRILPAGGSGVSPEFKSPPRLGDQGG
jgi:hypothetical protein